MAQVLDFESNGGRTSTGLELPLACSTALFLLSVGCSTVTYSLFAPTMGTMNRDPYHETFHLSQDFCSSPPTAFPF